MKRFFARRLNNRSHAGRQLAHGAHGRSLQRGRDRRTRGGCQVSVGARIGGFNMKKNKSYPLAFTLPVPVTQAHVEKILETRGLFFKALLYVQAVRLDPEKLRA